MLNNDKFDVLYWRNTDKREVDIVLRGTDVFEAYETKWSKPNATASTKTFTNIYDIPVKVITKNNVLDLLW
jgi:hypothetical protein